MAAPKGNQFWKLRSKHGRDKLFASPELLWDAACEYFEWCEKNPIQDPRSFGGKQKIQRPFTLQGLCGYIDCDTGYFRGFKKQIADADENSPNYETLVDFSTVIKKVEDIIFRQQYENATIGVFKENLVARALGITEKSESTVTATVTQITGMEVK